MKKNRQIKRPDVTPPNGRNETRAAIPQDEFNRWKEVFERLTRIEKGMRDFYHRLFGNGQAGIVQDIAHRLTALEQAQINQARMIVIVSCLGGIVGILIGAITEIVIRQLRP